MKIEDYTNFKELKLLIYYIVNDGIFLKIIKILSKVNYQMFLDEASDLSYHF